MKYLLDTNILIYAFANQAPARDFIATHLDHCALSLISYIETLASPKLSAEEARKIRLFLSSLPILPITTQIAEQAIHNRRLHRIKLSENLIAATAQVHDLILVSRNIRDFASLSSKLHNPFDHV